MAATLFSPLLVVTVLLHQPAARRLAREAMENGAQHIAHLAEDVAGVETIKAFNAQPERIEEGERRLVRSSHSILSLEKLNVSMNTAGGIVSASAGLVILWYGGHRVIEGAMTIAQLMFFYTILGYMLGPLERLASVNIQLQDAFAAIDRLNQVLDLDAEDKYGQKVTLPRVVAGLELKHVSFAYGCRKPVLRDVSLMIPKGATVGIVGESGCGKSTLLKLLLRFYDPTSGQVLIDNVDMRDYSLTDLRSRIGFVSQEAFLFNGSIRQNIALGRPGARWNELLQAAQTAGLNGFVADLPERYDTPIGERGANLSGGQRQRVAIARALVGDPDVLLFDEATSHLDTGTERMIQASLTNVVNNKTVVVVAHRLSTIRDADVIYVMHQGRIVEEGDHRRLMQLNGAYAPLWRTQSEDQIPTASGQRHDQRIVAEKCTNGQGCPLVHNESSRPAGGHSNGSPHGGVRVFLANSDIVRELYDCTDFRQALLARPPALARLTVVVGASLLLMALLWAALTKADLVVRAEGRLSQ